MPTIRTSRADYLSPHFGRAPYFTLAEVQNKNYRIIDVVENLHAKHEHRGEVIINLLASRGVGAVITLGIGYGAFTKLRELGIRIYYVEPATHEKLVSVEEALNMFVNNKLAEATEPREHD
ncbi:NifB/NifX family molybdenum-iron cluster-binding protein [Desulfurococcus amylolyticus]|uniref:NifB/NifX family molybdenum-iron cluster-binding protein n=1 Tax=Desulfurococcus amylolyticus TaxID=94694 RepID=UPI0012FECFF0|nr:NifB/NifX family molybdenum-iron cluster-binding protein [Desulfurococcus amylolyticus]